MNKESKPAAPRLYRFAFGPDGGDLYDAKRGQHGLLVSVNDYDALLAYCERAEQRIAELERLIKAVVDDAPTSMFDDETDDPRCCDPYIVSRTVFRALRDALKK